MRYTNPIRKNYSQAVADKMVSWLKHSFTQEQELQDAIEFQEGIAYISEKISDYNKIDTLERKLDALQERQADTVTALDAMHVNGIAKVSADVLEMSEDELTEDSEIVFHIVAFAKLKEVKKAIKKVAPKKPSAEKKARVLAEKKAYNRVQVLGRIAEYLNTYALVGYEDTDIALDSAYNETALDLGLWFDELENCLCDEDHRELEELAKKLCEENNK